jgi:hypothetical protein
MEKQTRKVIDAITGEEWEEEEILEEAPEVSDVVAD